MLKLVAWPILFLLFTRTLFAQCLAPAGFSMMPPPAIAGGQFSQSFLLASPHYYQPLNYYAPRPQVQPMLVPCGPNIRYGTVPLNLPAQSPTFNAFQAALPGIMEALPQLGQAFTNNRPSVSANDHLARAYIDRGTRPYSSSGTPLEFTSAYRDLDWSNSAGASGGGQQPDPGDDRLLLSDRDLPMHEETPAPERAPAQEPEQEQEPEPEPEPEPGPEVRPEPRPEPPQTEPEPPPVSVAPAPLTPPDLDRDPSREDISDEEIDRIIAGREDESEVAVVGPPELIGPPAPDTLPIIDTAPPEATVEEAVTIVDEGLEAIREAGVPLMPDCTPAISSEHPLHPLVHGAYRVIANFYQSCEVLDILLDENTPIGEAIVEVSELDDKTTRRRLNLDQREAYIAGHPYLSRLRELEAQGDYPAGEQCRNILERPPIFALGAKANIRHQSQDRVSIDLFRDQSQLCAHSGVHCESAPVTAIDCSGFVQASMTLAGRKIYKDQRNNREIGTAGFLEAALTNDTCVAPASFSRNDQGVQTLEVGDLVVGHAHHMFMISRVGPDPLGVNSAIAQGDCSAITLDHFDFELVQSGAGRSLGVARMNNQFPAQSQNLLTRLLYEAQKTCNEAIAGDRFTQAMVQTSRRTEFMVIRYEGEDDPDCRIDPSNVTMEGEECLSDCSPLERIRP